MKVLSLPLLLLLVVGCVSEPTFKYAELQSIKPGVTTRADVMKTFGEPKRIAAREERGISFETFDYFRSNRPDWAYSYFDQEYDLLSIELTNGVVRSWFKTR